jgi:hypothetical protein
MRHSQRLIPGVRRAERTALRPDPIPLRAVPKPRATRIATVQARIALDYYDRPDVRERVVEALLSELKER